MQTHAKKKTHEQENKKAPPKRIAAASLVSSSPAPNLEFKVWGKIRAPFLLPCDFPHHKCEWERFSIDQAGCLLCGKHHHCPSGCVLDTADDGHLTCTITGFVVRESQLRDEWGAIHRAEPPRSHTSTACIQNQLKYTPMDTPCNTWTFVNNFVRAMLDSRATSHCRSLELLRISAMQTQALYKSIRRRYNSATGKGQVRSSSLRDRPPS
jgi:hypothetical protein